MFQIDLDQCLDQFSYVTFAGEIYSVQAKRLVSAENAEWKSQKDLMRKR